MFSLPAAAIPTPGGNQVEEEEGGGKITQQQQQNPGISRKGTARSAAAMVGNDVYFLLRILFYFLFYFLARDQEMEPANSDSLEILIFQTFLTGRFYSPSRSVLVCPLVLKLEDSYKRFGP